MRSTIVKCLKIDVGAVKRPATAVAGEESPRFSTPPVAAGGRLPGDYCFSAIGMFLLLAVTILLPHLSITAAPAAERPTREIYVPFSDLHVLLQNQPQRVLIGRLEYDELVKKAERAPEAGTPLPAVVTAADYAITAGRQRAEIVGELTVDVLQDGLHALPLNLAGVGLRSAQLDDRAAAIGRSPNGRLVLFVEGIGQHRLKLEMTAPLETTAARQVLTYRLPRPAAATLRLEVPGDVEIKGGTDVIGRKVDTAANLTRFELLPRRGDTSLLMTLNSRLHRRQRAVIARCVVLDEVTESYEKLRAAVTLSVLHRAVDRFRFVVPDGFEITEVASPLLARWEVVSRDGRRVLEARLREQTTETVTLGITAIRAPAKLEGWSAPRLVPLDVIGSVTVLGLLVDDRLKAESLSGEGLIPIDASVLGAECHWLSQCHTAVAAWYAPRSDYALTARFVRPPAEMTATTSLLLVVSDKGLEVHGGVSLMPRVEKRFSFDFSVPADWQVTSVATADGKPLPFERYPAANGPHPSSPLKKPHVGVAVVLPPRETRKNRGGSTTATPTISLPRGEGTGTAGRVRVTIEGGIEVDQIYRANFRAVRTPSGWLADWRRTTVEFPDFAVLDATSSEGAIAVEARDDMTVRPDKIELLTPLSAEEKLGFGLADVPATLAYRRQGPDYAASLVVERIEPRMTARTFSFLRVDRDALNCHCEVVYTIEQSRVRQLVLSLPKETPEGISIKGLDGVHVKERSSKLSGERRLWTVLLAEPRRDRVRLAVDFQQRLPASDPKGFELPIVEAEGVAYQSGLVAVEGCAELDVRVDTSARQVDVGELAEADYQPGRRLLGAYGFVGDPPAVKIDVLRQPGYGIPPAIVQQCELDTVLSPDGRSQTLARFKLRSKASYLQVELPADAKLWAAELDGVPLKPQRDGRSVLIDLSAGKDEALKTLQITYADDKLQPVALRGTVRVPAPKLFLRSSRSGTGPFFGEKTISANKTSAENMNLSPSSVEVPLADFLWRLHLPSGYEVVRTGGTLTTDDISRPMPAAFQVAGVLYYLSGGISNSPFLLSAGQSARKAARRSYHRYVPETPLITCLSPAEKSAGEKKPDSPPLAGRPLLDPTKKYKDHKSTVGMTAPGVFSADLDIDEKDAEERDGKYAAAGQLAGVRSLKIDLIQSPDDSGRVVAFRSLGVEPRLVVTLADDSRFASLRWALALAVGLVGAALTCRSVRTKTIYILVVMLLTTLFSLVGDVELAKACNAMFFAAALLVPYYLAVGFLQWSYRVCYWICTWRAAKLTGKTVVSAAILLAVMLGANAHAKPQAAKERVIKLPDDAIILPYDPDWKNGIKDADKLLVPYKKYVELWNRAYPDKKIGVKAPPAPYALADASYKTLLEGEDFLLLTGRMEIDVFADGYVQIPLGLGGGVLTRAEVDGKPARLSVLAKPQANTAAPLAVSQKPADRSVVVLHVSGKGRHKLELAVRLKLARRGGWRTVEGVLPSAPAAALDIVVPKARTELRLGHVADCRHYETEKADQTIRTTLGKHGAIALRWRPRVAAGRIDRTLTAASSAVFDVREDGLRLRWRLTLEFRRAERDQFSVKLPEGYLLEKVEGANVRGWEVRPGDGGRTVEVSLLQAAKDREQFTLRLWRGGQVGHGELARFDVPVVTVADAALQSGRLTIRRSPLLEVRTLERSGVTRIDLPSDKKRSGATAGSSSSAGNTVGQANRGTRQFSFEQVLGIRPFESYSFATVPFTVRLSAAEVEARVSAVVETILKLAEHQRSLESRVRFDVRGRPVYRLRVLLPEGFRLDGVHAPGKFQYTVTKEDERPLLTVYLASGQKGEAPVVISGKLGRPLEASQREIPLPRVEVLDVDRQQGDIAVQVDPAFDVEAVELTGCESVLLGRLFGWLNPRQREVARLALHYSGGDYAGKLRLKPRTPDVVCDSITNVRVTDRSLEETILLDFNVTRAGVRRLEFLLPEGMADSRVGVPMLQRKIVSPAGEKHPGMVYVRLELQEDTMGQIRVVVENDRLLTPGLHQAPIPVILNGRTNRRYVVIDNAGRDEVVVEPDKLSGMDVLGTHGKDWTVLKSFLGEKITMAYLVSPDAERPRLNFHAESRAAVETVQAGIGLSETTLVVDANGAYRAEVVLHVNNATEQYLEIRLPDGASLWTARVAGEPVKPTLVPGGESTPINTSGATAGLSSSAGSNYRGNTAGRASSGTRHIDSVNLRVRIPLIKTAPGDLSYKVVLRYGGKMPALRKIGAADFPLIRCVNITPELSQAKLHLPERYRWFDFGGTMRRVADDVGLQVGVIQYQSNQLRQIGLALRGGDKWTKARAAYNLKQMELSMRDDVQYRSPQSSYNPELQAALSANASMMQQTQKEAARQERAPAPTQLENNRQRLNRAYVMQNPSRAKNVVDELGQNWEQPTVPRKAGAQKPMSKPQTKKMMVAPRIVIQEEEKGETLGDQQGKRDRGRQTQQAPETEALNRYQQRLAAQTTITTDTLREELPDQSRPRGGKVVGRLPPGDDPFAEGVPPAQPVPSTPVPLAQPVPSTGLASLDFELPTRGAVYRFTTPRGEQEITARYLSGDVVHRLVELAWVGVAVLVVWFIVGLVRRGRFDRLARPAGSWLLIGLGLFSLLAGVLPVAGLVVIVVGCWLKVRRLTFS